MTTETVHDPICHMDITIPSAVGSSTYQGNKYYFCSPGCKKDFDEDPDGSLKAEAEYDHSQPADHGMMVTMFDEPPAAASGATAKKPWWRFW